VPYFDILAKKRGNKSSFPIASGLREAASKPAFAVDTNARIAAIAITAMPTLPMKIFAPREIGVSEFRKSFDSTRPTVTKITRAYNEETTTQARNMPIGNVLPGSLHSSATLHTLVSPPYDIKTNPAVAKIEVIPKGAKGVNLDSLM